LIQITDYQPGVYTVDIDNGTRLVIESMAKKDIGDYVCEARGSVEFITTSTSVFLFGKLSLLVI